MLPVTRADVPTQPAPTLGHGAQNGRRGRSKYSTDGGVYRADRSSLLATHCGLQGDACRDGACRCAEQNVQRAALALRATLMQGRNRAPGKYREKPDVCEMGGGVSSRVPGVTGWVITARDGVKDLVAAILESQQHVAA
eukprot:2508791-Prymnesium_polylepis.1